ncbi:PIG-L family deacetylase [Paraburkholderia sp. BCC1886]|uniref:PIG-L family deacetylase n=1 Tax=Paraburkholderia sp. BCC1886 TaxID=2562670 RepID=UPI0011835233|nr:PIG-L family deacetylase [Paraburkholderia sp. BCC1886]
MRTSITRFVRGFFFACVAVLAGVFTPGAANAVGTVGAASAASAAECAAGKLVTVVAHLDDDLLFVDPAISERLDAGWCITTVHLIGGANGANFAYVQTRERASRLAYARMAHVPDVWLESNRTIAGKLVHRMVLKAKPQVQLLELRLPGGAVRGGRAPLALLWDQRAILSTYPMNVDGSSRMRYDRDTLSATLKAILAEATEIYTLNPDTVPFLEHPDHIYAARITRHVAQTLGRSVPIVYHVTYPTGDWPANLPAAEVQRKRDIVASYFSIDGSDFSHVFGEFQWDGNWVARRYAVADRSEHRVPDFQVHPVVLFNAAANRCASSTRPGEAPTLAACNGSSAQQWRWEPLTVYPGNTRNAALVNVATSQCVAERDGFLLAETCDQWDMAQRWTPWDFGLVYTPQRHCLGENDGKLTERGCTALTTRYRWSTTQHTQANDLRLATAMFGDLGGNGEQAAVYVQRQADGPGFNVYAASLTGAGRPVLWYANKVAFDPLASAPSCGKDSLCFDSARFLLGDFDGDGKADLMVVTAREDGTAFWLLRGAGDRFDAPRLWLQTGPAFKPATAQQYVAGDFTGSGRASVLIAQKRTDRGLDFWLVGSAKGRANGSAKGEEDGAAPRLVAQAPDLQQNAELLTRGASEAGGKSPRTSLVALERMADRVALTPISNDGTRLTSGARRVLPPGIGPDFVKAAIESGTAANDNLLVLLTPHLDSTSDDATIDVSTVDLTQTAGVATRTASLRGMSWSDVFPAVVRDSHGTALVLYRRTDAMLGDFYFTGGSPALSRYAMGEGSTLGAAQQLGALPGLFTETVRIDRLAQ